MFLIKKWKKEYKKNYIMRHKLVLRIQRINILILLDIFIILYLLL